jgi:tetratricopeptide (TPR) repeat protein
MPARISLTMIVKNEEPALPTCLAAARPWVDEIVVVDTGSTDRTREIAQAHGAHVVEWAWRDDFAAARNESLRHATGDWVLALDADETLTPASGPNLRRACEVGPEVVAYEIKIVCPREGDGGLVRLNWFPRLFRRLPGVRWEGVIHEQVVASLSGHGRIERAPIEVTHAGYTLTPEQMAAKAKRNIALLERQLREEPDYAPGWFQVAETYVLAGRLEDAIAAYRRCLSLLELSRLTLAPGVVAIALQNLGAALLQHGDRAEGLQTIEAALALDPTLAPAYVHLGNYAMAEGNWTTAEQHFTRALGMVQQQGETDEYQITPWLIHFLRGCALGRQARLHEAMACYHEALALNPRHLESLWLLALAASEAGEWTDSLAALERLGAHGRDDFAFHVQRASALSNLGRVEEAADAAQAALARDGGSPAVLALLAHSLAQAGRPAQAAAAYERLAAATPDAPGPWLALAQCRQAAGDHAGMMAAYQQAVTIAPESADVLFALGSACLRGGALEAAEECLAGAVERAPDRSDVRLSHALCLVKKGDLDGARRALDVLLERWPDNPQARELSGLLSRLAAAEAAAAGGRS